jgi:TMEM175 potassium channel family protein
MTKNRLEAFSDGVFAIVITLLILDVRFPADKPLTLETLRGVAPHLWAFVLSFVIVGVYWVSHHNMLHFIRAVDRQLLWLNLTLLLLVVFIPFPAALLGQHADNELAVALYGINLMLVNAAGTAMWLYGTSRPHLTVDGMTPALSRFVAKIHSAPILVYAAAIALAHWYVPLGLILFAAVPAFFILPNPFIDRRLRSAMEAPPVPAGTGMTPEKRFDTTRTRL